MLSLLPRVANLALTFLVGSVLACGRPAHAGEVVAPPHADLCRMVERAAAARQLPVDYLARLLWTESRFDPAATSPAGAQGIAQFMPGTAAEEGLADPRDPAASIDHAAGFLAKLHGNFGNLGLAAAA